MARAHGMKTLREECLALVVDGQTTLEEVLRVTGATTARADRNRRGERRSEDSPQLHSRAHVSFRLTSISFDILSIVAVKLPRVLKMCSHKSLLPSERTCVRHPIA